MDSKPDPLHILFFPQLAHGHLIPIVDMARLFARQPGVKSTIVTTQLNASLFTQTIENERRLGIEIDIRTIKFPFMEAGLPEGCENFSSTTSQEMGLKFIKAVVSLLRQPLERILEDCHPNCLVVDAVFPWATDVARKLGIPRLVFHGTNYFTLSVFDALLRHEPQKYVTSDYEPFEVPGIPDKIEMTRLQQPDELRERVDDEIKKLMYQALESEVTSYGVIMNSFQELEPSYAEHYRKVMGRKTWSIGPLSLCNRNTVDKSQRGSSNDVSISVVDWLRWLDSRKQNSVLYVCFGSLSCFSAAQLNEIAKGLEASGQDFIWVVKKEINKEEDWLPEGFEERMEGKGLIIRGWAPQVLILDHDSVGGFMTHCGWNSSLESITAGVPMVTWPLSNEQFYNEKLITEILKVGVGVGAQEWTDWMVEKKFLVTKEQIAKAVTQLMVGEEANDIRIRSIALKEMAKRAVEEGGSSHFELKDLLDGLRLNNSSGRKL